jgi:K+ transporter
MAAHNSVHQASTPTHHHLDKLTGAGLLIALGIVFGDIGSYDNDLPLFENLIMKTYFFIKGFTPS